MDISALQAKLVSIGQSHVLRFYDELPESGKKKLISQLQALHLDRIKNLVETHVKKKATIPLPKDIKPVEAYPRQADAKHRQLYQDADRRGHELLKQGKIGAFLVAGWPAGLYWIAAGDILCIIAIVLSAWVLMVEILR